MFILTDGTEGCLVPGGDVGVFDLPDPEPLRFLRIGPVEFVVKASINPALS